MNTKSNVFIVAHKLKKEEGLSFSEALKKAWVLVNSGANVTITSTKKHVRFSSKNNLWFDRFFEEKGIDQDLTFEVEGASGISIMSYRTVIENIKASTGYKRVAIRNILHFIDYKNMDTYEYLEYIAKNFAKIGE